MGATPAGQRDRRIQFEVNTPVRDALGVLVDGWTDGPRVHAMVRFGSSFERREAAAQGAGQTATFRVLSSNATRGIGVTDRIMFEGRCWGITGMATVGGPRCEIEFTATMVVEAGDGADRSESGRWPRYSESLAGTGIGSNAKVCGAQCTDGGSEAVASSDAGQCAGR